MTKTLSAMSTRAPSVTVVLPCYNSHQYLQQTLDSVNAQTLQPSEIILVDDGSDDPETVRFIDNLGDSIRVIRQVNKGLSAARNTGFSHAKSKYVLPLDCDDWLEPDFLEEAVSELEKSPDVAFVFADLQLEGERSGVLKKNYNHFEQLFTNQLPYCLLMRRSAWLYIGGYDEAMRKGLEDWEFNIRLGSYDLFGKSLRRPLFHYRVSSSGMLKSISLSRFSSLYRTIRRKHHSQYRIAHLFRLWLNWRHQPSTYRAPMLLGWLSLHSILPDWAVNQLMRVGRLFSHSARSGRSATTSG